MSLFFNRYVSSAAAGLSESLFDVRTGFMKSPSVVEQLACELRICQSGRLARGIAHNNLRIEGPNQDQIWIDTTIKRFIDGEDAINNFGGLDTLYDNGMRLNTNVYCFPPDDGSLPTDANTILNLTDCGQ